MVNIHREKLEQFLYDIGSGSIVKTVPLSEETEEKVILVGHGHTVNVYNSIFENVEIYTIEDFSKGTVPLEELEESMDELAKELKNEYRERERDYE